MKSGKTVFAQLMDFVTRYEFQKCVDRYNGNRKVISFSCWDQLLCMAFSPSSPTEKAYGIFRPVSEQRSPSSITWAFGERFPGTHWPMCQ